MQITAKLVQILPVESGMGKNGEWKKQNIIVETEGQYPKKVSITLWGDKVNSEVLQLQNNLIIDFDIESREYNGRWYTDVKAWKIESAGQSAPGRTVPTPPSFGDYGVPEPPLEPRNEKWEDDMPF